MAVLFFYQRVKKVVFIAEVFIKRAFAGIGQGNYFIKRGFGVAAARKNIFRGNEDTFFFWQ